MNDDDINYDDDDDDDVAFQGCHPFFFCPTNIFNDAVHINQIDCDLRNKKNDDDVETY